MVKKFLLVASSSLLKITLFSLALTGAGWMVFGTSDKIKQAAEENSLYDSAVEIVLENAKEEALSGNEQLPLDNPEIQAAAENAFPPELLSQNSGSIIDGFYTWLAGETPTPQFSVDLTDAKQRFADGVGDYAVKRYEALPPCTFAQLQTLSPDVDPFSVDCRPPGLLGSTIRERVVTEILNSEEFLKDAVFTAEDLPKDEQGRTIAQNFEAAPDVFSALRLLPWILGISSLLLATAVLFLSEDKRKGLRRIATTLLGTGAFLAVGSLLITYLFNQMNQPEDAFQSSAAGVAKSLAGEYNAALMQFYIVYIAVGAGILLTLWYQNRNTHTSVPKV